MNNETKIDKVHEFETVSDQSDVVRRLRAVARRIEVFFDFQMRKLNEATNLLQQLSKENEAALRLAADLENQRNEFESEKEAESLRLIEAGEKLAMAWQDLEDVQRQTPQQVQAKQQHRASRSRSFDSGKSGVANENDREDRATNQGSSRNVKHSNSQQPKTTKQVSQTNDGLEDSETTLFEMKLLQQQVAEHARRHNK